MDRDRDTDRDRDRDHNSQPGQYSWTHLAVLDHSDCGPSPLALARQTMGESTIPIACRHESMGVRLREQEYEYEYEYERHRGSSIVSLSCSRSRSLCSSSWLGRRSPPAARASSASSFSMTG